MCSATALTLLAFVAVCSIANAQPKKYIKDPVTQLTIINPEWSAYHNQHGKHSTVANPQALPIVSTFEDIQEWSSINSGAKQSEGFTNGLNMLQDESVAAQVGADSGSIADGVFELFKKYEVPIGMLNKLMELQDYHALCFLIDDSGSMANKVANPNQELKYLAEELGQQYPTRWTEAYQQILRMLEIVQYIPKGPIYIHFLNRPDVIELTQQRETHTQRGETPEQFYHRAKTNISRVFRSGPSGNTPMLKNIEKLFRVYQGKRVAHYWFGDGQPNGGDPEINQIKQLVNFRPDSVNQPITFVSCSDSDSDIKWMKDIEEVAPYCAEMDDFISEQKEVREDQGDVFPYSYGIYLICLLVGAMNPHDLDAFDESVPMTKFTLESLLGVEQTNQDYWRYFQSVVTAQQRKGVNMSLFQQNNRAFLTHKGVADSLPFVKKYKEDLAVSKGHGQLHSPYAGYPTSPNYAGSSISPQGYAGHTASPQAASMSSSPQASGYAVPYAAGHLPLGASAAQMSSSNAPEADYSTQQQAGYHSSQQAPPSYPSHGYPYGSQK